MTGKIGALQSKSDNGFAWIAAQPLLEPLLNMHTASCMSVILCVMTWGYLILWAIPVIHEINALREVSGQRVGKFLLKSIIALSPQSFEPLVIFSGGVTNGN